MSSGYYAHKIDDISDDCKVLNISLLQGRMAIRIAFVI